MFAWQKANLFGTGQLQHQRAFKFPFNETSYTAIKLSCSGL